MDEYLVCMREIPNVEPGLKVDLWNAAVNKRGEMEALHERLGEIRAKLSANAASEPTRSAQILLDAFRATGWAIQSHTEARTIIYECRQKAGTICDPVARNSAQQWLGRALAYADAERRPAAITCMRNATGLLGQ